MPVNHAAPYADLTEEQYAALGRVVVEWANVEYLLSVLLSRLLRTPEYLGRTYASGLSAVKLQSAIDEAVEIHRSRYRLHFIQEATLKSIEEVNSRVTSLRASRNKISHFCWSRSDDESIFGTAFAGGVSSKKRENQTNRKLNLTQLKALHTEAYTLAEELLRLTTAIGGVSESAA